MKNCIGALLFVVLGAVAAVSVVPLSAGIRVPPGVAAAEESKAPRWVYKVETFERLSRAQDFERALNERGAEGWELFTAVEGMYIFKRLQR